MIVDPERLAADFVAQQDDQRVVALWHDWCDSQNRVNPTMADTASLVAMVLYRLDLAADRMNPEPGQISRAVLALVEGMAAAQVGLDAAAELAAIVARRRP